MPSVTSIVIKGHGGADGFVHLAQARVKRERERERERGTNGTVPLAQGVEGERENVCVCVHVCE
jgi:hypothetical protein